MRGGQPCWQEAAESCILDCLLFIFIFLLYQFSQGTKSDLEHLFTSVLRYIPQSVPSLWFLYRAHLQDRKCSPPVCAPARCSRLSVGHHWQRRMSASFSPAPWNAGRAVWPCSLQWKKHRSLWSCVRGCGLLVCASLGPRRCTRQSLRRSFGSTEYVSHTCIWHVEETKHLSDFYLYPMSSQPLSSWWKRCMERMSAEHCSKVRQGWLGVWVWWMYKKERGRVRLVGVPLYGCARHMQRGTMGGQSVKDDQ